MEGHMKAVILAGGKGSRLAPYTKVLPKPLMPIGEDMPILEVLLRQLKSCGIDEVTLAVGYSAGLLYAFFQDGKRLGLNIRYSFEDQPLGTAGPLSLLDGLDDTFLVTNGDVLTTLHFPALVEYHRSSHAIATIASYVKKVRIDLGVIRANLNSEVVGYIEKPTYDFLVSMGVYVFEPHVMSYIGYRERLDFPDLVLRLLKSGERILSYPFEGYWMDLGRVEDYEQAIEDFEGLKPQLLGERVHETMLSLDLSSQAERPLHEVPMQSRESAAMPAARPLQRVG
jgi:NDP-sugar pyrophosphorylase family protein